MNVDETDGVLVCRVRAGDEGAFSTLMERHGGLVFKLTHQFSDCPEDAEDLAQEVFMKAYRNIDRLRNPDRFSSWLHGIALNRCRDYAKNVRRQTYPFSRTTDGAMDDNPPTLSGPQFKQLLAEEHGRSLWAALRQIPAKYATPFLQKYRDDLTYQAMAEQTGLTVSALKVRVFRARKMLREQLERIYEA